jgi:hypothetical protein
VSRLGDPVARADVSGEVAALAMSPEPASAVVAARVYERSEAGYGIDRTSLRLMLAHADATVVTAALRAVQWPDDDGLLPDIVARLADRRTARSAVDALGRGGSAVLDLADLALQGELEMEAGAVAQLPRVCRTIGGERAAEILGRHVSHPDRDVGLAVIRSLAELTSTGPAGAGAERAPSLTAVIQADVADCARILGAEAVFANGDEFASLTVALRDELALRHNRLLAALGVRHGTDAVGRVAFQLAQPDPRARAVALEWLDVTLAGAERAVIALLEPDLPATVRLGRLGQRVPVGPAAREAALRDLIDDDDGRWRRPYLSACAVLAAVNSGAMSVAMPPVGARPPGIVAETLAGLHRRVSAR